MQDFFIARQPIFDRLKNIFGYELLFRDSLENVFPEVCPNEATSRLIDGTFMGSSLQDAVSGTKCFINFTFDGIQKNQPTLIDPEILVVEILETLRPGKRLLEACKALKEKGYTLALDDYIDHPGWEFFFPYIDIIKIDIQHIKGDELSSLVKRLKMHRHIVLLAERVETHEEFKLCSDMGFGYFQGFFFSKPEMLQARAFSSNQVAILDLMQMLVQKDVNFSGVTRVIENNIELTYRLLTYANSARFKNPRKLESVKHAVTLLGHKEVYKFTALLLVLQMDPSKPNELAKQSLIRGRLCEILAARATPELKDAAFLVGLLSMLDIMFDIPMTEIVQRLPVASVICNALIGKESELSIYLDIVSKQEIGNFQEVDGLVNKLGVCKEAFSNDLWQAITWCESQMAE
jgi:EAL and modified HD-GYP domain-containing signal transduction protein